MPNIANVLKEEIRRLARKEIKAQVATTRRAAVQHRRDIAELRRQLRAQERLLARLQSQEPDQAAEEPAEDDGVPRNSRFSARSVRAQRRRLKLSAEEFGKLLSVSALTVYNWEKGKARPRRSQFARLIAIRTLGRREALQRLAEIGGSTKKRKPR